MQPTSRKWQKGQHVENYKQGCTEINCSSHSIIRNIGDNKYQTFCKSKHIKWWQSTIFLFLIPKVPKDIFFFEDLNVLIEKKYLLDKPPIVICYYWLSLPTVDPYAMKTLVYLVQGSLTWFAANVWLCLARLTSMHLHKIKVISLESKQILRNIN